MPWRRARSPIPESSCWSRVVTRQSRLPIGTSISDRLDRSTCVRATISPPCARSSRNRLRPDRLRQQREFGRRRGFEIEQATVQAVVRVFDQGGGAAFANPQGAVLKDDGILGSRERPWPSAPIDP